LQERKKATGAGRGMTADDPLPRLVRALKEAAGPVSGEGLAAAAGVSRAAVWKHVQRLKSRGYAIAGTPRRGYRLLEAPDRLLPEEIFSGLGTARLGGAIHHAELVDSTNDLAKELGAAGAPEGALVVAEAQRAGRGRLGRSWESPPGAGLYVSLLLRPDLPPENLPRLTLAAGVAAARGLGGVARVQIGLKWPNDLIVAGKKAGGILTEMTAEEDRINHLVLGLGVNVNNRDFPVELRDTAISLAQATGRTLPRAALLRAWLEEMEMIYEDFLAGNVAGILEEWRALSVTLGRTVSVRQGTGRIAGYARDVAPDGALLLETGPGQLVRVLSGELAPGPEAGPGADRQT